MNRKFRQLVVACLLGSVLLTGCVAVPASPAPPAPQAAVPVATGLMPLRVGVLPFLSNSPLAIAQEEGYFREQGLAVELIPLKSDNDAIPLLLKGDLDVATPGLTAGLFNAIASGGNIKAVFPLTSFAAQNCATIAVVARRSDVAAGRYATPAQWKGARVTLPPAGAKSLNGYVIAQALQQHGLALSDVTLAPADLPAQADALAAEQTDLVYAVEPWVTRMLGNPALAQLMPLEPVVPDLTASLIVFGPKPLADLDLGKRFAAAYLKAVRQYAQGKTARNVELVAAYTQLDAGLVKQICWPVLDADINTDSIMSYLAWLQGQGLLDRMLKTDEFLDARFVKAAKEALGETKP
jgi:NitT/TauT family transport system substrate-binding protein